MCITNSTQYSQGGWANYLGSAYVRFGSINALSGGSVFYLDPNEYKVNSETDLALLKLSTPVQITPVSLTSSNNFDYVDNNVTLLGWGGNIVNLEELSTPIVDDDNCVNESYQGYEWICVGNFDGHGIESGDSGGPLLALNNGVWTQIGVARGTYENCTEDSCPSHYVNIAPYYDWIQCSIGNTGVCAFKMTI